MGRGISTREDNIVRASADKPQKGWLPVIGATVEKIAKALFDYLVSKECTLEIKSENETVEVVRQDSPQKIEKFLYSHKGTTFTLKIKL
jgi:hypothetical protein